VLLLNLNLILFVSFELFEMLCTLEIPWTC
jgi:hypothetical protein